jgi:hypothetical protein
LTVVFTRPVQNDVGAGDLRGEPSGLVEPVQGAGTATVVADPGTCRGVIGAVTGGAERQIDVGGVLDT